MNILHRICAVAVKMRIDAAYNIALPARLIVLAVVKF